MKTGILGGTFNPVHMGHLILAENARDQLQLDRVLFIPSGVSYLKDQSEIVPAADRIAMVRLAIDGNPFFELSTLETDKPGNSYTCETLRELHEENPSDELYFIGGADILMSIHTWKDPDRILKLATLVIAPRNFTEKNELEYHKSFLRESYEANVIFLDTFNLEISSSTIRERIRNNHSIRYYLPDSVESYIEEHQLYIRD